MKAHTDRREVAVETLQQQVKEINSRLTYLQDTMVEMNKVLKVRPKKQPKKMIDFGSNTATAYQIPPNLPQVNLLTVKKPGRPRNSIGQFVKAKKPNRSYEEYKRIMKHGASVG